MVFKKLFCGQKGLSYNNHIIMPYRSSLLVIYVNYMYTPIVLIIVIGLYMVMAVLYFIIVFNKSYHIYSWFDVLSPKKSIEQHVAQTSKQNVIHRI